MFVNVLSHVVTDGPVGLVFRINLKHEYANEMSFILTIGINIFVIYGITGAITSCHNDSFFFCLEIVYL